MFVAGECSTFQAENQLSTGSAFPRLVKNLLVTKGLPHLTRKIKKVTAEQIFELI